MKCAQPARYHQSLCVSSMAFCAIFNHHPVNMHRSLWAYHVGDFNDACAQGDLQTARSLYGHYYPHAYISSHLFTDICANGQLDVAKWALSVTPSLDLTCCGDYTYFYKACCAGHLEVSKWLLDICPTTSTFLRNPTRLVEMFCYSCAGGHLEMAKWLFEQNPGLDITARSDYAYYHACENGRVDVAKWLRSLNPARYRLDTQNDKISSWSVNYY